MNEKQNNNQNITTLFLGIATILAFGLFFISINKTKRNEGKPSLNKKQEINLVVTIRCMYIIIAAYFFINACKEYIEYKEKNANEAIMDNEIRQIAVTFFILLASLINVTTTSYPEDIILY